MRTNHHFITATKAKLHVMIAGKGKPVLFLHGGPGSHCDKRHLNYFDLRKHKVFLLDQRGCGKSTGTLTTNTTQQLIADITVVLDHFKIKQITLFGGSWGSTLALAYAIAQPLRVHKLFIYALYLASKKDEHHMMKIGPHFFPQEYEQLLKHVPQQHRTLPHVYLWKQTLHNNRTAAKAMMRWELRLIKPAWTAQQLDVAMQDFDMKGAKIYAQYMLHRCYLPKDYILKNLKKIQQIPTTILHGRHDLVCPVHNAYAVHERLAHANLHILPAMGHGGGALEPQLSTYAKTWL